MWNLRILSPKGKRGREIAYHRRGDARFSKPEEITRLSKLVRQRERERERLHGTRDIRNAARINYESINAKLSALRR